MRYKEWEGILSAIDEEAGLNKDNVIDKIGEKLQKEFPTVYEKWKEDSFNVDHVFEALEFRDSYNEKTLLHLAAQEGHIGIVNALLAKEANVHSIGGIFKSTPLHIAAKYGHVNIVNALLAKNADVDYVDKDRLTPLHCAAVNPSYGLKER